MQPGHRLDGPQRSGIGQRDRRAGKVVGRDLVGVDLAHQLLVGADEPPEVERVGVADAGHQKRPVPTGLLHVDRQPEPDVAVADHPGGALPVDIVDEGGVHGRNSDEALDHRVADQMGEADLAAGGPEQLVVDDGSEQPLRGHFKRSLLSGNIRSPARRRSRSGRKSLRDDE